jgi:hypothetical protein
MPGAAPTQAMRSTASPRPSASPSRERLTPSWLLGYVSFTERSCPSLSTVASHLQWCGSAIGPACSLSTPTRALISRLGGPSAHRIRDGHACLPILRHPDLAPGRVRCRPRDLGNVRWRRLCIPLMTARDANITSVDPHTGSPSRSGTKAEAGSGSPTARSCW